MPPNDVLDILGNLKNPQKKKDVLDILGGLKSDIPPSPISKLAEEPAQPGRYGAPIEMPAFPEEEREPFMSKLRRAYDPRLQFGAVKQVMAKHRNKV